MVNIEASLGPDDTLQVNGEKLCCRIMVIAHNIFIDLFICRKTCISISNLSIPKQADLDPNQIISLLLSDVTDQNALDEPCQLAVRKFRI